MKARQLLNDAIKVMDALHSAMLPDPDDDCAIVPPDALRRFVDAHATLLYEAHHVTRSAHVLPESILGDFLGSWVDARKQLPDADLAVVVQAPKHAEPVWLGYYNGERWFTVEDQPIDVVAWTDLPEFVEVLE